MVRITPPLLEFAYTDGGKRQKFSGWRRVYRLARQFTYDNRFDLLEAITVPEGFESDLATVPTIPFAVGGAMAVSAAGYFFGGWAAFLCVLAAVLLVGYLRPSGPWAVAAIVHDYLYRKQVVSRREADSAFYFIMIKTGVCFPTAMLIWASVRLFGWLCYGREFHV